MADSVRKGMLERESILAGCAHLIERARAGFGGALFVLAEAGMGKTSVLHRARDLARSGFRTGAAGGDPMETTLPYGLVAQALAGLESGDLMAPTDATTLGSDGVRSARFYRVLRGLEGLSRGQPVLLALDDLHWADGDSMALVSFLCRRIESHPIAILGTLRRWPPEAEQICLSLAQQGFCTVERLLPLSEAASGALLAARLGSAPSETAARRAWDMSGGNPLLLEQVALAVRRGEELPDPAHEGASRVANGLLLSRFAGLPPAGLACARVASVLGVHFRPEIACELAQMEEQAVDLALESLWRSGLVRQAGGDHLEFTHPLFRQALYDDLGAPLRARLHARAFHLLSRRGLAPEAAEHALRGGRPGDPAQVAMLEKVGRSELRSGAVASALRHLDAAVTLGGLAAGPELRLGWAEALLNVGRAAEARTVIERVLEIGELPIPARFGALRLLGDALHATGDPVGGAARALEAAKLIEPVDRNIAVQAMLHCSVAHWSTRGIEGSLPFARRARDLADDPTWRERAHGAWGLLALAGGDPEALPAIDGLVRAAERDPGSYTFGDLLGWLCDMAVLGTALSVAERFSDALRVLDSGLAVAEPAGAPRALAQLLRVKAETLARLGRLEKALRCVERARTLHLAPPDEAWLRVIQADLLLSVGRLEESQAQAGEVEPAVAGRHWRPLLHLWNVQGHRDLREGRLDAACRLYLRIEELSERMGVGEPCWVPWARHAIAAYLARGRLDDASRVIAWLEGCRLPCVWPRIAAVVGRAGLAGYRGDRGAAEDGYRAALAMHGQVELPLEKVETLLDYGAFLRRAGQPRRARPLLAEALNVAEACGASWLAGHASQELAVAGGRRRRRAEREGLTPQERRVVALAAEGKSNQEIASHLSLGVRTIETHLEHAYAKLGISSRRQLMLMAREPAPDA